MSLEGQYNCTADFERPANTQSTLGGVSRGTYTVAYNDVGGMLQPLNGRAVEEFSRRGINVNHVFYTATSLTLTAGDRVVISSVNYLYQHLEDQAGKGRVYAVYLLKKA